MTPHEKVREQYLERFGVEAPYVMPVDHDDHSEVLLAAIKSGQALPELETGAVT